MKRRFLPLSVAGVIAAGLAGCVNEPTSRGPTSEEARQRQVEHQQESLRRMRVHQRPMNPT
jgi:outer membrane lipoprotein SlyB